MRIAGDAQSNILLQYQKHHEKSNRQLPRQAYNNTARSLNTKASFAAYNLRSAGLCAPMAAYYLKSKVKENGNFWEWLADNDHKLEVMSLYLDDDYKMLRPASGTGNVDRFMKGHFHYETTDVVSPVEPSAMFAALTRSRDLGLARLCLLKTTDDKPAHAIAFVYHAKPRLYDPNHSEWIFDHEQEFRDWLTAFRSLYWNFTRCEVFYYS